MNVFGSGVLKRLGLGSSSTEPSPEDMRGDGASGPVEPPEEALVEMSFLDHLEDLRWALLKGMGGVLVAVVVCAIFSRWIIDVILLGPAQGDFFMYQVLGLNAEDLVLQNRTITGQFFAELGTVVAAGIVIGSPLFVYFMWKFIEPGLYPNERKGLRFSAVFATLFFMLGIAFGYLIVSPVALHFFANYVISDQIENIFDITKYFSMVVWWAFGTGLLFELPVVVFFLAKMGFATPEVMREYRKYALIGVLVVAALFTPPDPVSQLLIAVPLMLLYEGSIYVAAFAVRKRERELREALQ